MLGLMVLLDGKQRVLGGVWGVGGVSGVGMMGQ